MKFKLSFKSIKFRIWLYFVLFTAIILALMWFLQIFFLNNYYEDMKIQQTQEASNTLISKYDKVSEKDFLDALHEATVGTDIYVQVENADTVIFPATTSHQYTDLVKKATSSLKDVSNLSNSKSYSETIENLASDRRTYMFATYLDDKQEVAMFVAAPLYPVSSTILILQDQLISIMVISLILAFVLSFYLSTRISKPITSITNAAKKLAEGDYGITFPTKSQYTEIDNLANTLNKASCELEKSVMLQKDLMANVSHDLRTPLTMIKSYAEMIRDLSGDNPQKRNSHLEVIIEESDRLNTLVGDMLALSAMQSGTMSLDIKYFNLKETVETLLMPYEILEEQEGFKIYFSCKHDVYVKGDAKKIKQVVSNLVTNAIKYCGSDQKVFVNIKRWGKRVHCEVVDHGVGIKPEELSHIWDRYYKTSSNHVRSTTGSGLGLSIVKEILSLHEAKFGAESKVGKGTTVWFELPVAHEEKKKG